MIIGREIVANTLMSIPVVRRLRVEAGRTIGSGIEKFRRQFAELEPSLGELAGKRVVELGPGDVVPMAWEILRRGAASYVAVDRFGGNIEGSGARALYRELGAPESFPSRYLESGQLVYHLAPAESFEIGSPPADLLFSVDVLEHVSNPSNVFRCAYRALRPGARMVHHVDLSPHAQWRRMNNPLEFLAVPEQLWAMMASNRGLPNRLRAPAFERALREAGFRLDRFEAKTCFEREDVEEIRKRLARPFRAMKIDELLPAQLLIVATKPDDAPLPRPRPK